VTTNVATPATSRLASIDTLRGFTIFWILGGDALAWALKEMSTGQQGLWRSITGFVSDQLQHVSWEGFTFYDFIFPLLIFVTGVSIVLSLSRLTERKGRAVAHLRVLRRSLLLFALGVIYYGGASNNWPDVRLLGVLQRIALCYLFASLVFLNLRMRGVALAFVALLVGYWALMTFVPVPDTGTPSLTEEVNLARWIDTNYLPGRRWYGEWDPEGLLSTLPAIATCLLGVLVGFLLQSTRIEPQRKVLWLIGTGIAMIAAGYLWSLQFPIIKNIWTSSYVLVAGGYSTLLLGVLYQVMDIWGVSAWATVFGWIGANAITLYMAGNIVNFQRLAARMVGGDVANALDDHLTKGAGNFVIATVGLALAITLARFLHRRKIFLRV
jgi:predicted acyltransferase